MRGYVSGGLSADTNSRLDFRKVIELAMPVYFPETGTDLEQVSMGYHAVRNRPSAANALANAGTTAADFVLNGAPPVPGGPIRTPASMISAHRSRKGPIPGSTATEIRTRTARRAP